MRVVRNPQMCIGETPIEQIEIDPKSRDDIPQILRGLQHLYSNVEVRESIFAVLEKMIPEKVDKKNGRPGMTLWQIFVLSVLRLNLNWNYDRLQNQANAHRTIRQMLGHGDFDGHQYHLQTLKDNIKLFTPEVLDAINQIVVEAGHKVIKKKDQKKLHGRCDSFVVKTNVHFPTDITLLLDAMRKSITLIAELCKKYNLNEWRQYRYNIRRLKKACHHAQNSKRSTAKDEGKKAKQMHQKYLKKSNEYLDRVNETLKRINQIGDLSLTDRLTIEQIAIFVTHAVRQIDQTERRVIKEETIPHNEKVFSIFQPHTEWVCKGKAGVPVELGVKVCIMEDQYQFILHHEIMQKQTDEKLTVPMFEESKKRFSDLDSVSYDRGFFSKENRTILQEKAGAVALPKKGRLSEYDKEIESGEKFSKAKRKHSAVESAINALDVHGLDKCPDSGITGFKRYAALAIVARNIQRIGAILQKKEQRLLQLQARRRRKQAEVA